MGAASPASRVDFAAGVSPFFPEDGFFLGVISAFLGRFKFQFHDA
jgi:hypothetical protein